MYIQCNNISTQIETIVQENKQHQDESMMTDRHHNEGTNATATLTPSPATGRPPHLMTGAECMLPREAYDALEWKRTVHCNQGQPEDKATNDEAVDIKVRVTVTGTQDTTVHQENTQLDQTNGTSSETSAILNQQQLQHKAWQDNAHRVWWLGWNACCQERHMMPLNASTLSILI